MSPQTDIERIESSGVVAILRGIGPDAAIDVAEALQAGGISAIELTADSPGVLEAIETVADAFSRSELIVGVGTVLDAQTARSAMLAGAEFVVSPCVREDVVDICNRHGVVVAPGALTPTEAITAYETGADLVKLFPAGTVGPEHVRALSGPLGQLPLMPTGGVDLDNVGAFIEAGANCVGVGSALIDDAAVERGDFASLTRNARAFGDAIDAARGRHS